MRTRSHRRPPLSPEKRLGAVILEFIIVFPAVFIATLAVFQFGILALVMQTATTAAIEGARTGAAFYPPLTPDSDISDKIVARVNSILDLHQIKIETKGAALAYKRGTDSIVDRGFATAGYSLPTLNPAPDEIALTLTFPLVSNPTSGAFGSPVPNWLASYGLSFIGSKFQMTAVASLE